MKELTIEEKAQRYDEALDCAKLALDCLADDYICNHLTKDGIRGMYAKLFPELVESDDERIKFNVGDWCIDNEDGTIFQIMKVLDNTYAYKTNEGKEYSCTHYSLENDARLWTIQDAKDGDVLADDASVILFRKIGNKKYEDVVDYHCVADSGKFKIQEKDFYWGKTNDVPLLHPATKEQRDTLMKAMADAGYIFDFEKKELRKIEQKSTDKVEPKVGDWLVHNERRNIIKVAKPSPLDYKVVDILGYHHTIAHTAIENNYHLWSIADAKAGDVLAAEDKDKIFIYNGKLDLRGRVCAYCGIYKTHDGLRFTECAIGNYFTYKEPYPATKEQRDLLFQKMKEAGYEWDAEKKELKKIEQKSAMDEQNHALNDEDIRRYNSILSSIEYCSEQYPCKKEYDKDINWLKDRVQPQPKQEWSEEDERMYRGIHNLIYSTPYCNSRKEFSDWLESLKGLVQPKQEWKQENTGELTDFENAMMYIGGSFFGQYAGLDPNDTNTIKKQANILLELVPSKEWSEEDKYNFSDIEAMIHTMRGDGRNADKLINWLKERIQPQTNITDEELAQAKKDAYNDALDKIEYHSSEPTFDDGWSAAIGYLKKRNTY